MQLAGCVDGNGASNQEVHFRKDQKEKLRGMRPLGNDGSETSGLRRPFPKAALCHVKTLGDAVYSLEEPGSTRHATGQVDSLQTQSQDEVDLCPAATFLPELAAWSTHAST